MSNINTPYDDVYRTLQNDCPKLIIPVVNELFGEVYTGEEKIEFSQNELFFQQADGETGERITDSSFVIISNRNGRTKKRRYHIECQSTPDGSMIVRIFEYDTLIAIKNGKRTREGLIVNFPQSAVLYLRHTKNTPDKLTVRLKTPGGSLSYVVPILKVKMYSIEEIFEKNLLFLIPFYFFSYEAQLRKIAEQGDALTTLREEYAMIRLRLDEFCDQGKIDEYTKQTIITMTVNVVSSLARKYKKVVKEVTKSMGGNILEYEAKDILNRGKQTGDAERLFKSVNQLIKNLSIDLQEACRILGITPEEYENAKKWSKEGSIELK